MKTYSNKRRLSSLLNVFPQETILRVIESASKDYEANANGKNLNSSSEDEQLLKLDNSQLSH